MMSMNRQKIDINFVIVTDYSQNRVRIVIIILLISCLDFHKGIFTSSPLIADFKYRAIIILLSDLDNCKWSGPDFWQFAIKKFAIIKKFLFNNYFFENSSSDEFNFIKTYLINKNIIKFNFNLTLLYYILKLSPSKTLRQKK